METRLGQTGHQRGTNIIKQETRNRNRNNRKSESLGITELKAN